MNRLQISLFGNLKCVFADQPVELDARKAQELLCYLLLHRGQLHEREKLAALLWADKSPAQCKKYLRQTLWQLQTALNQDPAQPPLVLAEYQHIGINPKADFQLDVAVFEQAFLAVDKKPGQILNSEQVQLVKAALPLYTTDLLEGWYQDWCIYERERYQNIYLTLLDKLIDHLEIQQQYKAALAYAEAILKYDRAREQTHRQLMRLHYLAGSRTAALHQYETCVAALAEELSVRPAKSTIALYHQICADQLLIPEMHSASPVIADASAKGLPVDAYRELEQIQLTLAALQNQISHLIQQLAQH